MAGSVANGAALQAQLDALKEQVGSGFGDLKQMLQGFDDKLEKLAVRVQGVEQREAGCQPLLTARLAATERTMAEHAERLKQMEKAIEELAHTNKVLQWLLGIFTTLLIAGALAVLGRLWQVLYP